eukprot:scaffold42087_cov24-Tisochrysis_lutea.AAC.1
MQRSRRHTPRCGAIIGVVLWALAKHAQSKAPHARVQLHDSGTLDPGTCFGGVGNAHTAQSATHHVAVSACHDEVFVHRAWCAQLCMRSAICCSSCVSLKPHACCNVRADTQDVMPQILRV